MSGDSPKVRNPYAETLRRHAESRGKIQVMPRCGPLRPEDFAIWPTPGFAAAVAIKAPELGLSKRTSAREHYVECASTRIRRARIMAAALFPDTAGNR